MLTSKPPLSNRFLSFAWLLLTIGAMLALAAGMGLPRLPGDVAVPVGDAQLVVPLGIAVVVSVLVALALDRLARPS